MLYNVADAYYKTGNFDAAAEHYKQVLETDDAQLKRKALYNLGNAEFRRGKAKEAIGHYEAALSIAPDDRQTKENLEFVKKALEQQQQQQEQSARRMGTRTIRARKKNPNPKTVRRRIIRGSKSTAGRVPGKPVRWPTGRSKRPEFGDEMDDQQEQQASQGNDAQNDQQPSAAPQPAQPGEPTGDPQQAERMLNRLQDQPGRALMPATGNGTWRRTGNGRRRLKIDFSTNGKNAHHHHAHLAGGHGIRSMRPPCGPWWTATRPPWANPSPCR
jgi:Ca-activated chloride channel family protein